MHSIPQFTPPDIVLGKPFSGEGQGFHFGGVPLSDSIIKFKDMEENLDLSTRPGTHLLQEVEVVYKPGKKLSSAPQILNSCDAYHYIRGFFAPFVSHHEEVWAILLNTGHRIIGCSQIAKGGIDCTTVDVRIIFQTLLLTHATGLILVHNHPGGATKPSVQDEMLTEKVAKAGKILDIKLLDHLIVTSENYFSFADERKL